MDAGTRISIGGAGTGLALATLSGAATRSVPTALAVGAAGVLAGGFAADHLENVNDKYGGSSLVNLARPSVGISLAAGSLAGGAIGHALTKGAGLGLARTGAAMGAGILAGAALGLTTVNFLGLD